MDRGSDLCTDGFELITSSAECKEYADSTEIFVWSTAGYYDVPLGCFIYKNYYVHFIFSIQI